MYVFAANDEEHSVVLSFESVMLTNNVYSCMYVRIYLCVCDCMYVYVHSRFISFPIIHVIKYYYYESISLPVPIGRRSHICSREWGCGRG